MLQKVVIEGFLFTHLLTYLLTYLLTHWLTHWLTRLDRDKFGNKVLRCYVQHGYKVIPINKKSKMIEEIAALPSLTNLISTTDVSADSIGVLTHSLTDSFG